MAIAAVVAPSIAACSSSKNASPRAASVGLPAQVSASLTLGPVAADIGGSVTVLVMVQADGAGVVATADASLAQAQRAGATGMVALIA